MKQDQIREAQSISELSRSAHEIDPGAEAAYIDGVLRLERIEAMMLDRTRVEPMDVIRVCTLARSALHAVHHAIPVTDGIRFLADGRVAVTFMIDRGQALLFGEAIDTAHTALCHEVCDCDDSGDTEGVELKKADLALLERLQRLFDIVAGLERLTEPADDMIRRDSVGQEAPTQDASSAHSGSPLASLATAADGSAPSGGGGLSGVSRC